MAPLVSSIDIAYPQDEVFAYVTDPSTFREWQAGVVGGSMKGATTPSLGAKCMTRRRIGGAVREVTSQVTRIDPPTSWGVRGIDGPIRAIVDVTVESLDDRARSRVTIAIDFEGHGIGTLLVPLVVRRQARREMPANCARLKQRLEQRPKTVAGALPRGQTSVICDGLIRKRSACGMPTTRDTRVIETVYEAAGGAEGLLRLASAWHARVMADEAVSHAFSHGFHPEHTERLAAYWAEALGGPMTFSAEFGNETSVVRMHSGNGPHDEMDRRAVACFDQALTDVGLAKDDRLRQVLHDYFAWATATTMARYHDSAADVPDGLHIPRWSWAGLVGAP